MTTKLKFIAAALCAEIFISGCATRPDTVKPDNISRDHYKNASCSELTALVKVLTDKERELCAEMDSTANSQVAANVFGTALLLATGIGYTRTVDNSSYGTALAKVRGHLIAAREQGQEIGCDLPAPVETKK